MNTTAAETYLRKHTQHTAPYFARTDCEYPPVCASDTLPQLSIIIPCLAESAHIVQTLDSLCLSAAHASYRLCVICVVNNHAAAESTIIKDNQHTLSLLKKRAVIAIDASSPQYAIPQGQGVGFARKIGMDYAIHRLKQAQNAAVCTEYGSSDCVLVCLDADTLVSESYISAIGDYFFGKKKEKKAQALVLPFVHQHADDEKNEEIIRCYETYLQQHSKGLYEAHSPYYHIALGSAIACTVSAYCAAGGMNCRLAGEDFYFLQQLIKTGTVQRIQTADKGALVFPSARISDRVPFGTGMKIKHVREGADCIEPYPPEAYRILAQWIHTSEAHALYAVECRKSETELLLQKAYDISPELWCFLQGEQYPHVWQRLFTNNATSPNRLYRAFHTWFDGLKTIRLFHHLAVTLFKIT